jgi:O-antigen/teichoic acid export membrane protein
MGPPILRRVSGVVLLRGAGLFLAFLSSVVFARALAPDELGSFSYVTEIVLLVGLVATLGLPQALMQAIASAAEEESAARMRNLVSWSLQVVLLSSLLFGGGLGLFAGRAVADRHLQRLFFSAAPIVALFALSQVCNAVLWGQKKIELSLVADSVLRPCLMLAFTFAAFGVFQRALTAQGMLYLSLLAFSLALAFLVRQVSRATSGGILNPLERTRRPFALLQNAPFFFGFLITILGSRVGTIALGTFRPFREVAYYKVAFALSSLITLLFNAANTTIAPHIAEFHGRRRPELVDPLVRRTIRPVLLVSLALLAVFVLFGRRLISACYGETYVAAAMPLVLLACGQVFDVATGPINTVLKSTGHQRFVVIGQLAGLAANLSLLVLLVPSRGVIGAATATVAGIFLCNSVNLVLLRRHTGFSASPFL